MYEYQVSGLMTELPRGSHFITVPEFPLQRGTLALFSTGEFPHERLIVGRWYPDIAGCDWIWQPERWIRIARDMIVRIIGRIVPITLSKFDWILEPGLYVLPTYIACMAMIEKFDWLTPVTFAA